MSSAQVGQEARSLHVEDLVAQAAGLVTQGLEGVALADSHRTYEQDPLLALYELAGGQVPYMLGGNLGVEGKVEALKGLHLLEAGPGHPIDQLLLSPSLHLVLQKKLQEVHIAQMVPLGLPHPQLQGVQHAPQLESLELAMQVMEAGHGRPLCP